MTQTRLRVVQAGPLVTFQDAGRPGHKRFGVCSSGPMDTLSYAIANFAVGNNEPKTAIEVSVGGLELECLSGPITLAVCGGEFQIRHGDNENQSGVVFTLEAGETLSIKPGRTGNWCYLAFAGDVVTEQWLGHATTHGASGLGGGALTAEREIKVENCRVLKEKSGPIALPDIKPFGGYIRIVIGPQDHHFETGAKRLLLNSEFALSGAYDRMGARLDGPKFSLKDSLSIPSEPILKGSIQVSGDGVPTILLADHQTTGGYPKIATVISSDIDDVAQLQIRKKFRFMPVTPESAIKLARLRAIELAGYFAV